MLNDQPNWFADGTFYVSPDSYTQLYTIHVLLGTSETIPCIYTLPKNKSSDAYDNMLKFLQDMNPDRELQPETITIDYEQAAISSFQNKFPNASVYGCFFRLSQNRYGNAYRQLDFRFAMEKMPNSHSKQDVSLQLLFYQ